MAAIEVVSIGKLDDFSLFCQGIALGLGIALGELPSTDFTRTGLSEENNAAIQRLIVAFYMTLEDLQRDGFGERASPSFQEQRDGIMLEIKRASKEKRRKVKHQMN